MGLTKLTKLLTKLLLKPVFLQSLGKIRKRHKLKLLLR